MSIPLNNNNKLSIHIKIANKIIKKININPNKIVINNKIKEQISNKIKIHNKNLNLR